MKDKLKYLFYGIVLTVVLGLFLFNRSCSVQQATTVTTTDTVYVKQPYKKVVVKEVEVTKPVKVYVYKTDTVYRKQIERDTLITGIEFTRRSAKIHTITPRGAILVNQYPLNREIKSLTIDHEGKASIKPVKHAKRKKFLRRLGKVGIFVAGIFIGNRLSQ